MRSRLFFLNIFFLIFTAAIIVRLFSLQVLGHDDYLALAEDEHGAYKRLIPKRGEIFAVGGNGEKLKLATSLERDLVAADPKTVQDPAAAAVKLAPILGMPEKEIMQKLSQTDRRWVIIKKELPERASEAVAALKLAGIYLQPETLRFYPENALAAQVLGFWGYQGAERRGQYGVEDYFEEDLRGRPGEVFLEENAGGAWIVKGFRRLQPAEDGQDLTITILQPVQFKAEEILRRTVETHGADGGTIAVMDPRTGAILAMASYPTFDPNEFSKAEDQGAYRNRAVTDAYEPGSVFKAVTMAAALEAGAVTPDETYEDKGSVVYDKFVIRNSDGKAHGVQTMTQVLEQSLNTGAIYAQDELGPDKFLETVKALGFGQKTGITLPAQSPGNIQNLFGGGDVHYATASFGQGITVTPLQLLGAFSAFANGGKMVKPYIVEGRGTEPVPVFSSKTAATISAMLVSVVENGHGKQAGVPGYYVAGKTGTAQIAASEGGGYDPHSNNGTFAGFAPVDDPRFVMVVKIENPKDVRFAESTAAPAFGEMARFLLNFFRIPPSR